MPRYISMLRGINVSGQKQIKMDTLRVMYESMDCENVITYIQSGNVVFDNYELDMKKLEVLISNTIQATFSYTIAVTVCTAKDLALIMESNPYLNKKIFDPSRAYITFLSSIPTQALINVIIDFEDSCCELVVEEKCVYLYCDGGYGRTKLSNNFFEKKLEVSATTRSWKTLKKLVELAK